MNVLHTGMRVPRSALSQRLRVPSGCNTNPAVRTNMQEVRTARRRASNGVAANLRLSTQRSYPSLYILIENGKLHTKLSFLARLNVDLKLLNVLMIFAKVAKYC